MIALGNSYKFFIEDKFGNVLEFPSVVEHVQVTQHLDTTFQVDISLLGTAALVEYTHEEVKGRKSTSEWMCSFCDRPNSREKETCESCGAVRSFIYE